MTGINPADVAAGVLIAAFFLIVIGLAFKKQHEHGWAFFGIFFLVAGAALVWWRIGCWTGHIVCT